MSRTWIAMLIVVAACHGDHHATDAGRDDASTTECGSLTCANAASFCYSTVVGAILPADGPSPGCNDLPAACTSTPTCACVQPTVTSCTGKLACDDSTGTVRLTCSFP